MDVVDEISIVKFVFIMWVGEGVKLMIKGKISIYKFIVEKVFYVFFVINGVFVFVIVYLNCNFFF